MPILVKGLRGGSGGVKICPSPLTLIVALTTLALPCECVIKVKFGLAEPTTGLDMGPSKSVILAMLGIHMLTHFSDDGKSKEVT